MIYYMALYANSCKISWHETVFFFYDIINENGLFSLTYLIDYGIGN